MNGLVATVAVTFAIQVAVSGAGLSGPVIAPLATDALDLPPAFVGIYVAYVYALSAIVTATSGAWLQRFGAMGTSQLCLVFSGLSLFAISIGTVWGFVLAGFLAALGYGPTTPASSVILSRNGADRYRNLIFSIKQTGVPAGNMLAAALLPSLALALGWREACAIAGAVVLAMALAVAPLRKKMDEGALIARAPSLRAALFQPMRTLLTDPDLRRLAILSLAYGGLQGVMSTFTIVFLIEAAALDIVTAGFVLAVALAMGAVGRIVWGIVADRTGQPARVIGWLGIAMGVFGVIIAFGAGHLPLPVLTLFAGCFGGTAMSWNGVFLSELARGVGPARAGEIVGASGLFTFGGVAILPSAFAVIVLTTGSYANAYALATIPAILIGVWQLRASRPTANSGG